MTGLTDSFLDTFTAVSGDSVYDDPPPKPSTHEGDPEKDIDFLRGQLPSFGSADSPFAPKFGGMLDSAVSVGSGGVWDALKAATRVPEAVGEVASEGGNPLTQLGLVKDTAYEMMERSRPDSNIVSDVVGGLAGATIGLPRMIGAKADKMAGTGQGVSGLAKRAGVQGSLGAAESAAAAMLGNDSTVGVMADTLFGAGGGIAGQLLLGDALPYLYKGLVHGRKEGALRPVVAEGAPWANMHPDNVMAKVDNGWDDHTLLDLPVSPQEQTAVISDLVSTVQNTTFPKTIAGFRASDEHNKAFAAALNHVVKVQDRLYNDIRTQIDKVSDIPSSSAARVARMNKDLAPIRKSYDRMFSLKKPGQGGHTKIPGAQASALFERNVEKLFDGLEPTQLRGDSAKYYNRALHLIRGYQQDPNARTIHMQAIDDTDFDPADLEDVSLIELLKARQQLQRESTPGITVNQDTVTKQAARDGAKMVEALDLIINDIVGQNNKYLRNKEYYSKVQRTDEMFDQGVDLFRSPSSAEVGDGLGTAKEWFNNPNVSKDDKAWMRKGYRSAFGQAMKDHSPYAVLSGILSKKGSDDPFDVSESGMELLTAIYDKDTAEALAGILQNDIPRQEALEALNFVLKSKEKSPEAGISLVREGDKYILTDPIMPGSSSNNLSSIAFRGALTRELSQPGPGTATALMKLMGTQDPKKAKKMMKDYLKSVSAKETLPAGGAAALVGTTAAERQEDRLANPVGDAVDDASDSVEDAGEGIMDYLQNMQ